MTPEIEKYITTPTPADIVALEDTYYEKQTNLLSKLTEMLQAQENDLIIQILEQYLGHRPGPEELSKTYKFFHRAGDNGNYTLIYEYMQLGIVHLFNMETILPSLTNYGYKIESTIKFTPLPVKDIRTSIATYES